MPLEPNFADLGSDSSDNDDQETPHITIPTHERKALRRISQRWNEFLRQTGREVKDEIHPFRHPPSFDQLKKFSTYLVRTGQGKIGEKVTERYLDRVLLHIARAARSLVNHEYPR